MELTLWPKCRRRREIGTVSLIIFRWVFFLLKELQWLSILLLLHRKIDLLPDLHMETFFEIMLSCITYQKLDYFVSFLSLYESVLGTSFRKVEKYWIIYLLGWFRSACFIIPIRRVSTVSNVNNRVSDVLLFGKTITINRIKEFRSCHVLIQRRREIWKPRWRWEPTYRLNSPIWNQFESSVWLYD